MSAFVEEQYPARYVAQDLDHYLFVSRQHQPGGQPISRRQVWVVLSEAGKKAGLKRIGPHSMRKNVWLSLV
nr:tyrosine-type recombinase/integrase [Listeria rocourtiae]